MEVIIMRDLTTEVLKFDNKEVRARTSEKKQVASSQLFDIVTRYVGNGNGNAPSQHDVVYGLRVAGELAGDDDHSARVMLIADTYNQGVGHGNCIHRINFYERVPTEGSVSGGPLSQLRIKGTLDLRDGKYHSATEE